MSGSSLFHQSRPGLPPGLTHLSQAQVHMSTGMLLEKLEPWWGQLNTLLSRIWQVTINTPLSMLGCKCPVYKSSFVVLKFPCIYAHCILFLALLNIAYVLSSNFHMPYIASLVGNLVQFL